MHNDKWRQRQCASVHYLKDNTYQKSKICILFCFRKQMQTLNVNLVFVVVSIKFVDIKKRFYGRNDINVSSTI